MAELIEIHSLEKNIYEIKFLQKNRAAVDEFFMQVQAIYSNYQAPTLKLLIDLSIEGMIPMQYLYQESLNWRSRNPKEIRLRAAILYPKTGILPIARALVSTVARIRKEKADFCLLSIEERNAAITWLMEDSR